MEWLDGEIDRRHLRAAVDTELARLQLQHHVIRLRRARKLSQAQLAKRMRISQPLIARIESGRARNLTVETLLKIAGALNAEVHIEFKARPPAKRRRAA